MAQLTNLNVSPYYDDFDKTDDFHKVLFRPGFAIQARELTTLQSILQHQVEKHGEHMFKEGTVVIPGQVAYSDTYYSLAVENTFGGETVNIAQFFNESSPVIITGATSGVKAQVINYADGTTTSQPYLYLQYIQSGDDLVTEKFADGENLVADIEITHTTTYSVGTACLTTFNTSAANTGSAVTVEAGVYFIRGNFVRNAKQTIVLSNTSSTITSRVGFTINETLVTPESDESLTDNATGSSNFAAKGAHRLKINLTLSRLDIDAADDQSFVELIRLNSGEIATLARGTEYSVLGNTLAARTFDESGNYTVRPFGFEIRESIDNDYQGVTNLGTYASGATTDDGGTAAEDLLTLKISAGKAYVKGYRIEKLGNTRVDISKARDVKNVNAGITTFELGNFLNITNVYGTPDIGNISGETTPYKEIKLFTDFTETRGSSSGYQIGVTRARAMEYVSGTPGQTSANFKVHIFDTRLFTFLNLSGIASPSLNGVSGVKITGNTSGATGFTYNLNTGDTTNDRLCLTNVVGNFVDGEKLLVSNSTETDTILEDSSNADLTLSATVNRDAITKHEIREARSLFMDDADSGEDFTADCVPSQVDDAGNILLDGTDSNSVDAGGRVLEDTDGTSKIELESQLETKLIDADKNLPVFRLPERPVKTLLTDLNNGASDTQFTVRRQFVGTTNASGVVTFTARSNETFDAFSNNNYLMSVITAGSGTAGQGDIILLTDDKISGEGTGAITVTDNTLLGNGAKVKFIGTITRTSVQIKTKTTVLSKQLKVLATDADGSYGVRATDRDISLGRADAFKVQAVFDSRDTSTDATAPELTLTNVTGTFLKGEKITGSSSGAVGRAIDASTPMSYTLRGSTDFTTSDTITGAASGATAKVSTVTAGSTDITSKFSLDTGMRDNFYDISRLVRKQGQSAPLGRLLVVYDYFIHGAGDAFTVDSYSSLNGQMEYDDIPTYTGSKIDPNQQQPTGTFDLRNCYDFRPTVEDIAGASSNTGVVDQITGNSFNFENRQFDGVGAVVCDMPKPATNLQADFEFYLPKRAALYLTKAGEFKLVNGISSESPTYPKDLSDAMKLALLDFPAYTFKPDDVIIEKIKNQRFTMKDIGRIKDRLENIERLTTLSLLERDAESFEIQDANGLNRFKSGFVVDNFAGHRVGDVLNEDYEIAVDPENNELRPKCVMRQTELEEKNNTDTLRTAAGYQKTGDIITLPYTSVTLVDQPYATRLENVQPFINSNWVGQITLSPSGDNWFETEQAPRIVTTIDNFSAVAAALENQLGTIWNAWETQWSGVVDVSNRIIRETVGRFHDVIDRTITTERGTRTRDGVRTEVIEDVTEEVVGTRILSQAAIPFVRPRTITITGVGFLPNTRLYPFFDGQDVSAYVTPASATYTTDTTLTAGGVLKTTPAGKIEATFQIPDYRANSSLPKFSTGDVEFRLTSSSTDQRAGRQGESSGPSTAGQVIYTANGVLNVEEESVIATRNAIVVQNNVSQSENVERRDINDILLSRVDINPPPINRDPLAQTFLVEDSSGVFLTEVDLFFAQKDENLPVWVEVRTVVNGYPGERILPFGRKLLESSEVNVNETTGTTATTFTFDSPIYVEGGQEYCVVVRTNSLNYRVWISQMNELDVSGSNRVVSKQPTLGVLFKSQNNKTWNAVQSQDLKMHLKKAKFTVGSATVQLDNSVTSIGDLVTYSDDSTDSLGEIYGALLKPDSLRLTNSNTAMEVSLTDHGMYSTSNNVEIRGAKSGITTTLNGAINATATSLTLTSNTNFTASNLSSRLYLKIGNEILFGTLSGSDVVSLTRGTDSTTAAAHADGATIELYQLFATPLTEINKVHTAIANIEIDKFTVSLTTAPTVTGSSGVVSTGGSAIYSTRNHRFEIIKTNVATVEVPGTTITATAKTTSGTSPSGTETSFNLETTNSPISINENFSFDTTRIVCSEPNETNELSSAKSFQTFWTLSTTDENISPIIDSDKMSCIMIANRFNNITGASQVFPTTDYRASTEPNGDNNAAIYITKKIALENPATSIKVFFAGHRKNSADIKVLFKILRNDASDDFDDVGYEFFNTTGTTDVATPTSLSENDFREYVFTAGVSDDGDGIPLPEFNTFAIKIVMMGTNAAQPPRIRDLRVIALST